MGGGLSNRRERKERKEKTGEKRLAAPEALCSTHLTFAFFAVKNACLPASLLGGPPRAPRFNSAGLAHAARSRYATLSGSLSGPPAAFCLGRARANG
jgi:hypothetical protein